MLSKYPLSEVEKSFLQESGVEKISTLIPYLQVDNFPKLGLLTACRFLEWVAANPEGVISLPTGKSPEFFIKWTQFLLENWDNKKGKDVREKYGLGNTQKPVLKDLTFVQIDEFYPISSKQNNSFFDYVNKFYIQGFGLSKEKAILINSDEIPLANGLHFKEIFPDLKVDLSLRFRDPENDQEKLQQESIYMIDQWCGGYEQKIRDAGGIGFFLGGIGPDGHIAFNTRGSHVFSVTRLTETNFETQAVAAGDLGGIEISSNRLVITIGLDTIVYNPEAVAIIIAAGEAKAGIVKDSLETPLNNVFPGTVLQKLKNGRFYVTKGAGVKLTDSIDAYYQKGEWTWEKTERSVIDLCKKLGKYGHRIKLSDLKADKYTKLIPDLSEETVNQVMTSIENKLSKGLEQERDEVLLHTGPHHDDISLGILPHITNQLHEPTNKAHFSVLTSGFTAVTNTFVIDTLQHTKKLLDSGKIQMVHFEDFFEVGYSLKTDKDVYHYLTNVASEDLNARLRGLCHRVVRALVIVYEIKNKTQLRETINDVISILKNSYDGEKNSAKVQKLKGMIREFEEELVWAHFGVQVKNVHHLRLGFYTGDIFTEQPDKDRDVEPIVEMFKKVNPTKISLTLDPEGSGPDTHYKVLQATAAAVKKWGEEADISKLRIIGYRNVWFKFEPHEVNVIVPVSLGDMSVMEDSFANCYMSQVNASFPSYSHNGKFSTVAKRIWVDQLDAIQLLLGKNYFYQHERAKVRSSHGLIFFRDMSVKEFLATARELEKSIEGML
ncbi:glucosamine-6-phosphate deaminase [Algoriphagus ratkowskyi]|uniref:Glucosamine-6-phosphate deaminase n=1 Tax=Algoriphagus ratkowskyi TaxID=57028 RepID=A0A2W7R2P5_9BACT|nr:PIG-L family deacetylase [Algoriphagus ratkowskyi]PZX53476.1 glucosamine-6-phosphate deaminase [Algoriphagus ratkowskyi]TXD76488.1 glucosamine-6-phosphate isomerase [Algoriphagus ratkowskyi]